MIGLWTFATGGQDQSMMRTGVCLTCAIRQNLRSLSAIAWTAALPWKLPSSCRTAILVCHDDKIHITTIVVTILRYIVIVTIVVVGVINNTETGGHLLSSVAGAVGDVLLIT